jgi:hypothetical protein
MDPIKARINEINFLEFCARIESIRHKMLDIKRFIADLNNYFDFDVEIISGIVEQVFTPRFKINKDEVYILMEEGYLTIEDLSNIFDKSNRTIYRYKAKGTKNTLYPRLTPKEQEALDVFMKQYELYLIRDYSIILGTVQKK